MESSCPSSSTFVSRSRNNGLFLLTYVLQLPYRSQFAVSATSFTDTKSWRAGNCVAEEGTNGVNYYDSAVTEEGTISRFRSAPKAAKHHVNMFLDTLAAEDVTLPEELTPTNPVEGSAADAQFYLLKDGKTGVLALGSFSGGGFDELLTATLDGLVNLKSQGATQLIVDVVSTRSFKGINHPV